MAALCARISGAIARFPLHRSFTAFHVASRQPGKPFQQKLTWSQLKHMHYQSQSKVAVPMQFKRSRFSRHWLVMMATAGFSQGFLGFNFGKKEDEEKKKGDPLLRVYAEAKHAHMTQDFNKAEIRYHDALKVADEMLKLKKINFKTYIYAKTNIYDSLADMALGRGELEKAERLYKETMKGCLQQGLEKDDNAIIELSIKLSSIYAMMDRGTEAEQGLLFCIKAQDAKMSAEKQNKESVQVPDIVKQAAALSDAEPNKLMAEDAMKAAEQDEEEKKRDTQALLGMALETYGRYLMGQRRLSEAVPLLERALGVAEAVLGRDKGQYIILLNDLATAHILLRNWEQAMDILNRAIETATAMKSSQLPMLYCNLGAVFLRTSKLDDAEEACLKAQDLSNKQNNTMTFSMSKKCLEKIQQVKKGAA